MLWKGFMRRAIRFQMVFPRALVVAGFLIGGIAGMVGYKVWTPQSSDVAFYEMWTGKTEQPCHLGQSWTEPSRTILTTQGDYRQIAQLQSASSRWTYDSTATGGGDIGEQMGKTELIYQAHVFPEQLVDWISADTASYLYRAALFEAHRIQIARYILPAGAVPRSPPAERPLWEGTAEKLTVRFVPELQASFFPRWKGYSLEKAELLEGAYLTIHQPDTAPLTLICPGPLIMDSSQRLMVAHAGKNQEQVHYRGPQGEIVADQMTFRYREEAGRWVPEEIFLEGNVGLLRDKNGEEQRAIADNAHIDFSQKRLTLRATGAQPVLLLDTANRLQASARAFHLYWEQERVESEGVMRLILDEEEFRLLKERFIPHGT